MVLKLYCGCRLSQQAKTQEEGTSGVHVGVQGLGVVGSLGFRDALRPDAVEVVQRLRALGIRVALLSGDNAAAVSAAAAQAGIQVSPCLCQLILSFGSRQYFLLGLS